jgi:glycerol uptake facilitator-like aquaporin
MTPYLNEFAGPVSAILLVEDVPGAFLPDKPNGRGGRWTALSRPFNNFIKEAIDNVALVIGVSFSARENMMLNSGDILPEAFLVPDLDLSLCGLRSYALNPARDLRPGILHAILPIKGKCDSGRGMHGFQLCRQKFGG